MGARVEVGLGRIVALAALGMATASGSVSGCSTSDGSGTDPRASGGASGAPGAGTGLAGGTSQAGGMPGTGQGGDAGRASGASGGRAGAGRGGGAGTSGGTAGSAGEAGSGGTSVDGGGSAGGPGDALGPYPFAPSTVTRGGTMTFTNVGAAGWWPRRLDRDAGDPACTYKDGTDTWGGHCCMEEHATDSTELAPFDSEMTLILKAIAIKQLAVYQPVGGPASAAWQRVSDWDARTAASHNLWFTEDGNGSATFPGDLTHDDCVGYLSQEPRFTCGDYYCPDDPGVMHQGFSGSKLVVFLGSMSFDDAGVKACGKDSAGKPSPWVAFVASELIRDGGRKWNGLCNCYSRTGTVGDGCGEINVFEVVMDDNDYSNREFASTGIRSYQEGHVGGAVCQASCDRSAFPADADVVDACAKVAYERGPEIAFGGATDGCPVWRRPEGDRYFFILLDQNARTIQVGIVHPANIPSAAAPLLPNLPSGLPRSAIDALLGLRLPG
jgi:hypothetical protein